MRDSTATSSSLRPGSEVVRYLWMKFPIAMETRVLPRGVDEGRLAEWERRRVILGIQDVGSGRLAVGIQAGGAAVLDEALREAGVAPCGSLPPSCWVSVIGDPDAVAEERGRLRSALAGSGIEAALEAHVPGRRTFVVPAADLPKAVASLHGACFEGRPL